ncbi:MBL fold metallo-hydrolase [Pseudomaricurvus sp.]|uniref:MBL fold metallo-hydrolase n=1 Tax=Pseudomaricurvus sp. TaxID=2004510 RepID=UPI003F6C8E89
MIFRQLFDRDSSTYTYLLGSNEGKALIIDPVKEQIPLYQQLLKELGLKLEVAVDTHVHADHVTALGDLRDMTACVTMMGEQSGAACVSKTFRHGDVVALGELLLDVLYTPGHTDDSYCLYLRCPEGNRVFTGDTLLIRGTGRTDFQNGDASDQYHSLKHLLSLPDATWVYPGHDYKGWTVSTIGEEKRFNPRLQVSNVDEYVSLMENLKLANPAQMDVAVPANLKCGQTTSRP